MKCFGLILAASNISNKLYITCSAPNISNVRQLTLRVVSGLRVMQYLHDILFLKANIIISTEYNKLVVYLSTSDLIDHL